MVGSAATVRGVALLLLLGLSAPAAFAAAPPRRLFVVGDSLARDSSRYLHRDLRRWSIEENLSFARLVSETVRDLRVRARRTPPLAPVIHVSSGTGDDPRGRSTSGTPSARSCGWPAGAAASCGPTSGA